MESSTNAYRDAYFAGTETLSPDEMRIVALGTGRPFQRLAQANAGWLVELGNGDRFVFDYGLGSFSRFSALEVPLTGITALFASHLHADHVGDFAAYWVGGRLGGRVDPLRCLGPSGSVPEHGFSHFVEHQLQSYSWDAVTRTGLMPKAGETVEYEQFEWSVDDVIYEERGVVVRSFPAVHIHDGAVGFRLDWNGISLVYSGDTAPNRFLVDASEGADVVIHESFNTTDQLVRLSGYDRKMASGVGAWAHTQPEDAGHLFAHLDPGLAVAFHFNNDLATRGEVHDAIRKGYEGPLLLAEDLATINVRTGLTPVVRKAIVSEHTWPNKTEVDRDRFHSAPRGTAPEMSGWLREARLEPAADLPVR